MKATGYLAIVVVIVVVVASIAWFVRDSIIQRISGPLLDEYGLAITDVSLDALATDNASISQVELEYEDGSTIAIEGLTLPFGQSPTGLETYTADKVVLNIAPESDDEPLAQARILERILLLPVSLPNTEVRVTELDVVPYPAIGEIRWVTTDKGQSLRASIDRARITVETRQLDQEKYETLVSLDDVYGSVAKQSIMASVQRDDAGMSIRGGGTFKMPELNSLLTPIVAAFTGNAGSLKIGAGAAELGFEAQLPVAEGQDALFDVTVTPETPLTVAYSGADDNVISVSVRSASPVNLHASYPDLRWSIEQEQAVLSVSYQDWQDMSGSIAKLNCVAGPVCSMNIDATVDDADLTVARAGQLALTGSQDISFNNKKLDILFHVNNEIVLRDVSMADAAATEIVARLVSGAKFQLAASGWQLVADLVEGSVTGLTTTDNIEFSAPVSIRSFAASRSGQSLSMQAAFEAPSGRARRDELGFALPGISGQLAVADDVADLTLTTVGLHAEQEASIQAKHNLDSGTGELSIVNASLSFDSQKLSERVSRWPFDWEISAGDVNAELLLDWQQADADWQLTGQSSVNLSNLAGYYADYAFTGLSTSLKAHYDNGAGFNVEPARLNIDLVDVGLPVDNISADYRLNLGELSADVENLRMAAFGGVIQADPFSYKLREERNTLLLRAESIELTELLSVQEFEAIEVSGSTSAELPVTIVGDAISIGDGTLTGEAPGGVIRYRPDIMPEDAGPGSVGYVGRALSNFNYETLTSEVDYGTDGDLKLQMRIFGHNPDFEEGRPISLGLNVDNNIPQMLRSLRATRTVEEILERKLEK